MKYWYFTYIDYCPQCGRSEITRERRYTPKPENQSDRVLEKDVYDWCDK